MRRIKIMGLALVAVLAVAGVSANGASASITCNRIISHCTPSAGAGYAELVFSYGYGIGEENNEVFTWLPGGATTTMGTLTETRLGRGRCPAPNPPQIGRYANGDEEIHTTGLVIAASTFGLGIPAIGEEVSWYTCLHYRIGLRGQRDRYRASQVRGSTVEL